MENSKGMPSSRERRALLGALVGLSTIAVATQSSAADITYTYDELGRLKTATYPDGTVETFTYDAAGNRTSYVAGDAVPNAVDWGNISGASGAANSAQTITGINGSITLTVTYTGSGSLSYSKNSGSYAAISTGGTVSVANNDTLSFKATGNSSGTVTIANTSAGGTTLDTFTYSVTSDVTPAAVDWANISGSSGATNASQTITGIDTAITLTITYGGTGTIQYSKNSGTYTTISTGGTLSVSASDTLSFKATVGSGSASGTVTVTNTSDGSATLDTFTYSVTVSTDVTPDAVNWTGISGYDATSPYLPNGYSNTVTITGINSAITLRIEDSNGYGQATVKYSKNSGSWTTLSSGAKTVSMSNSDTLRFYAQCTYDVDGTLSVYNDSDGNALLDTLIYSLSTNV